MFDDLLRLDGVHTHIGAYHILHGVDLVVPEGQVTMLLGRNGAGKTTTLRTVMGLWAASQGGIAFKGQPIAGQPTPDIAGRGIANTGAMANAAHAVALLRPAPVAVHDDGKMLWQVRRCRTHGVWLKRPSIPILWLWRCHRCP